MAISGNLDSILWRHAHRIVPVSVSLDSGAAATAAESTMVLGGREVIRDPQSLIDA
jgi:hypothetical protein